MGSLFRRNKPTGENLPAPRAQLEKFLASNEPFFSFVAPNGAPWMVDRIMVEFWLDRNPLPSQSDLDEMMRGATRVRFIAGGCRHEPLGQEVKLVLETPEQLKELSTLLRLSPVSERKHCMCLGDYAIEFSRDDAVLAYLGYHHGVSLRWDGKWGGDASLAQAVPLMQWLAGQGLPEPLAEWERVQENIRQHQREYQEWVSLAPAYLREVLTESSPDEDPGPLEKAAKLQPNGRLVPDLLAWYSYDWKRTGGIPGYQMAPGRLLRRLPPATLVAALPQALSLEHKQGLCRHLRDAPVPLLVALPPGLKADLLTVDSDPPLPSLLDPDLAEQYRRIQLACPREFRGQLDEVFNNPHRRLEGGSRQRREELIGELLTWSNLFLQGRTFLPLRWMVDSLIVSIPLQVARPVLERCAGNGELAGAVARHLADAGDYPDHSFATFPRAVAENLISLGERDNPAMVTRLRKRLRGN